MLVDDATAPLPAARHAAARVSRGAHSAPGNQRTHNEDAYSLPPAGANEARRGTLCALADGVGGRPGGAGASRDAVHFLQALYYAPAGHPQPGDRLRECVESVNLLSRALGQQAGLDAEPLTTLVAAVAFNDRLWVANVGDSRAYLVRASTGECLRLTEDHSEPLPAVPAHAITRAIGLEERSQVDIYTYTWAPGDRLVLCSDGLGAVPMSLLVEAALNEPPRRAARRLVAEAETRDGSDNATAVLMGWEKHAVAPAGSARRRAARAAEPAWSTLMLVAGAAGLVGLVLGWLSAAVVYLLMGGPPALP